MRRWIVAAAILLFVLVGQTGFSPFVGRDACVAAEAEETVIFNTHSHIFHRPECSAAHACTVNCIKIPRSEAIKRGGRPCGLCGG